MPSDPRVSMSIRVQRQESYCTHTTWRTDRDGRRRVGLCGMRLDDAGHCPFDDSPLHK